MRGRQDVVVALSDFSLSARPSLLFQVFMVVLT